MFSILNRIESRINSASIEVTPTATYSSKVLRSNLIGNDLQSVLRPLNIMQALFICSKYKVCNKVVTVNSFTYYFIGVVCIIIYRGFYFHVWFNMFTGFGKGLFMVLNWSSIYDNFCYTFGFILHYYSNIKYRHKNVSLVCKIQHALTLLKVNSNELRSLKTYNWISVLSVNSVFIGTLIVFFHFFPQLGYFNILSCYTIIIFYIDVMYASFIIKILYKLLLLWIEDVREAEDVSDLERESFWNIKYEVYVDIIETYKLVEDTLGRLVALFTINTACHGLIHIATLLKIQVLLLNAVLLGLVIMVSQVWFLTSLFVGISLSINCERLYKAMQDGQGAITLLMYSIKCSDQHTLSVCKNIQRLQKTSFKKMNACGMFVVDALMSLRLFDFITTYTIVLIQFEFL